jgi:hypothetical protein
MRRFATLLLLASTMALLGPAGSLAAPPAATFEVALDGDCSQMAASLRWANQKHVRSYRLDLTSDDGGQLQLTGDAGRSGDLRLTVPLEAAAEPHFLFVRGVLLDRAGNVVADGSPPEPTQGACVLRNDR